MSDNDLHSQLAPPAPAALVLAEDSATQHDCEGAVAAREETVSQREEAADLREEAADVREEHSALGEEAVHAREEAAAPPRGIVGARRRDDARARAGRRPA